MSDSDVRTVLTQCGESPWLLREMVLDPRAFAARFGFTQRDVDALEAANGLLLAAHPSIDRSLTLQTSTIGGPTPEAPSAAPPVNGKSAPRARRPHDAATITVVMPTRNEWPSVRATVRSIVGTRCLDSLTQVVVVDDESRQPCGSLLDGVRRQLEADGIELLVIRPGARLGVAGARNLGVANSSGDVLFITDSHVRFTHGWDKAVLEHLADQRILAATIRDTRSAFVGYGCELTVPFMGTSWVSEPRDHVQVACSAGTILHRACFDALQGYDEGMLHFGAIEPEFSVRAWLSGVEIVPIPAVEVYHRFKPPRKRARFLAGLQADVVHNSLRFGLLYLNREVTLQMLRYFATFFPEESVRAYRVLASSDVWERRDMLARSLTRDFGWFIKTFDLRDQIGRSLD